MAVAYNVAYPNAQATAPEYSGPRSGGPGGVIGLTQTLICQNFLDPASYIAIDKDIKGGVHRVTYKSLLTRNDIYDGIFTAKRVKGMICYVEYEDDGSPCEKYYSLTTMPGNLLSHWTPIGAGAPVTINNPKVVETIAERNGLSYSPNFIGTVSINSGTTTITGSGTSFTTSGLVAGDKVVTMNGSVPLEVFTIAAIVSDTEITTVESASASYSSKNICKLLGSANDFVNVADSDGNGTPASYIFDGRTWLEIYPYGQDPNRHAPNTDTQLVMGNGNILTADEIATHIQDTSIHKFYNDFNDAGSSGEAWSSEKIRTELDKKMDIVNTGNGTLFLSDDGTYKTVNATGSGLNTGDILYGGNAQ